MGLRYRNSLLQRYEYEVRFNKVYRPSPSTRQNLPETEGPNEPKTDQKYHED